MTAPSEQEAFLRAALRAAADSLEPRDDGLERITSRLRHARPRTVVWLIAAWDALRLRSPAPLQDAIYRLSAAPSAARDRLAPVLASAGERFAPALSSVWERFAPASAPGKHRSSTQSWLRPLAAMAVVMFVVAAGTYVAIDISTAVSPSSTNLHPGNGGQPGPGGHTGSASPSTNRSYEGSGNPARSSPSSICRPGTSPSPRPSPAPSGSWTCAPTVPAQSSPSASESPNPSATPTPNDTGSSPSSPSPNPSTSS